MSIDSGSFRSTGSSYPSGDEEEVVEVADGQLDALLPDLTSLSIPGPKTKEHVETQEALLGLFKSGKDFSDETVPRVMLLLQEKRPKLYAKLSALVGENADKIEILREKGWVGLYKEMGKEMEKAPSDGSLSFNAFREELVTLVENASLALVEEMGYEKPGYHRNVGTAGAASDVDTAFSSREGIPEEVRIAEKLCFDAIFVGVTGDFSGRLMDTECYIDGAMYQTLGKLQTEEGKAAFFELEMSLAHYQVFAEIGTDPAAWKEYKTAYLEEAEGKPALLAALQKAFTEVEQFGETMRLDTSKVFLLQGGIVTEEEIEEMSDEEILVMTDSLAKLDPKGWKDAFMSYTSSKLVEISKSMDDLQDSITSKRGDLTNLHKQLVSMSPMGDLSHRKNLEKKIKELEKEVDRLEVSFASLRALRDICFDETYLSEGSFNAVVLKRGGQAWKKKQGERNDAESSWLLLQGRGMQAVRSGVSMPSLAKAQQQASADTDVGASALENMGFYRVKFREKARGLTSDDVKGMQKSLVSVSKYAERTLGACMEMLERGKGKASTFYEQTKTLYQKSKDLECCKRGTHLSGAATRVMLARELEPTVLAGLTGKEREEKKLELEKDIDTLAAMMDYGGSLDEEKDSISGNKYFVMVSFLLSKGYVEDGGEDALGWPKTTNPKINAILKARSGRPQEEKTIDHTGKTVIVKDPLIGEVLEEQTAVTLESLGLDSISAIKQFNQDMQSVVARGLVLNSQKLRLAAEEVEGVPSLKELWDSGGKDAFKEE